MSITHDSNRFYCHESSATTSEYHHVIDIILYKLIYQLTELNSSMHLCNIPKILDFNLNFMVIQTTHFERSDIFVLFLKVISNF